MAPALDPDKPFRYRVGSEQGGWSRVYWLDALPRDTWTFIHYGDVGLNEPARRVLAYRPRHPRTPPIPPPPLASAPRPP